VEEAVFKPVASGFGPDSRFGKESYCKCRPATSSRPLKVGKCCRPDAHSFEAARLCLSFIRECGYRVDDAEISSIVAVRAKSARQSTFQSVKYLVVSQTIFHT
jgi:hypothetical protein